MGWTQKQIKQHKEAARLLEIIKNDAFRCIRERELTTELEVQQHIEQGYRTYNLKSALNKPIVAFGPSAALPHYDPSKSRKNRTITNGMVVEIDVWGRLNEPRAPFADITWVGYVGKRVPKRVQEVFDIVIEARDASISLLRRKLRNKTLPTGKEVDAASMQVLRDEGFEYHKEILHTTGHSIGTTSPHGRFGGVSGKNKRPMKRNIGYTIEPGIYLPHTFGIRSEIDLYITSDYKLEITTAMQKKLLLL